MVNWLDGDHDFELDGTNRRVTGAFWRADAAQPNSPMVLMGHGASGDRYQAPIPHLAKRFTQESGFSVLAIDGPVHGLRQVGPGGREALAGEMQKPGFIENMVIDWLDAYRAIVAETGLGQGPLGYFGLSMGTIFGLTLLASELEFTAATIGLAGTTKVGAPMAQDLLSAAHQVTHPILFLMQLEDELFDRDGYLFLFDALASEDKRLHANPGLHPEIPAEEIAHTYDFLQAHLSGTATRRIVNPLAE